MNLNKRRCGSRLQVKPDEYILVLNNRIETRQSMAGIDIKSTMRNRGKTKQLLRAIGRYIVNF